MSLTQTESSVSAAQAYREKMFKRLGQQDPLKVLAGTAAALADVVNRHSATVLRARPLRASGRRMRSSATSPTVNGCMAIASA